MPTGLFIYGAYGHDDYADDRRLHTSFAAAGTDLGQSETWYGKGGIRQRWNPLGHTILYGEYENIKGSDAFSQSGDCLASALRTTEREVWGGGIVQEIDAAAMSIWLKYRHLDYSDNNTSAKVTTTSSTSVWAL